MGEEWLSTVNTTPHVGRRVQRKDDPEREYIITEVSNKPVWHWEVKEWPHGTFCGVHHAQWRYTTDEGCYFSADSWYNAIKSRPLEQCLDFNAIDSTGPPTNKPGDIPFPHSWVEVHIQLATSTAEELDRSKAITLENTDALINKLQTTGEISVCIRGCSCDPCKNTASANFENRKELLREKARDLIEFDPEILKSLLREEVGSNVSDQLIPWLKQLGES